MSNSASRLITLILLLQQRPNQKAAELAQQLGISVRTLHRYLGTLDEMGIPVYSERGPYGGFSLVRGYRLPPLVFTPEEAVAVCLGTNLVEELWGQLYRQAARGALAKLENVLPDEQRQEIAWAQRSMLATGLHRTNQAALTPVLEKLRRAVREHFRVQLHYQGSRTGPSQRSFDPYALVHRWGWWYVIGYCHLRRALRTFRVDRIQEVSLLCETFTVPETFELRAYLDSEPQPATLVTARLRFAPQAAQAALDNRSYWTSLAPQADGSVEVTFSAPTLEWAASSVLVYGPIAEVLDPPALRQMVSEWAAAIARQYQPENDPYNQER